MHMAGSSHPFVTAIGMLKHGIGSRKTFMSNHE